MRKREERAVTIPLTGEDWVLEGLSIAAADDDAVGVVMAAPHPAYGGSMDSPVVSEVAYAARDRGLASLRFNWRGVGASGGTASSDFADADADYRAALSHLGECVPGAMVAAGYSFGSLAAVRCGAAEPRVRALLLVAPPPRMLELDALQAFPGDVVIIVGDRDEISPAAELERVADALPRARFFAVEGADHFFMAGLADIGRIATKWLARFGGTPESS
jgi:alpha/beta superfamily hydrolase